MMQSNLFFALYLYVCNGICGMIKNHIVRCRYLCSGFRITIHLFQLYLCDHTTPKGLLLCDQMWGSRNTAERFRVTEKIKQVHDFDLGKINLNNFWVFILKIIYFQPDDFINPKPPLKSKYLSC